jgi:hypothetical protein
LDRASIPTEPTDWTEHPKGHDVAVIPIPGVDQPPDMELAAVFTGMFVTQDDIRGEAAGVGDDVYMIGRFINHEGKARNTPSARFGNISMLPGEPIYVDSNTQPQESFAVELRSMCGYSGSPVFVTGHRVPRRFASSAFSPDAFLGVHWGHIIEPWTVESKIVKRGMQAALAPDEQEVNQVSANTGMNGVVPAWRLMEILDMSKFKSVRDAEEKAALEKLERDELGAKLDSAAASLPATDVSPNHRADFNSLLGAAVKTPARED